MTVTLLVTRPQPQAVELVARLAEHGIDSRTVPTVAIDPDAAREEFERALDGLSGADWLVLTSANGADAVADHMRTTRRTIPAGTRVAAVGPATARALEAAGIRVDHVPARYLTVEIAAGLGDVVGRRVILARADAATPELRDTLLARGAVVEEAVAYRTIEAPPESRDALDAAFHARLDGITFTSSSTVRGLIDLASPVNRARARSLPCFCIGPITAGTAKRAGFDVAAVADEHTAAGLAGAASDHFERAARRWS